MIPEIFREILWRWVFYLLEVFNWGSPGDGKSWQRMVLFEDSN